MQNDANNLVDRKAYIITGPTSGIGRATAQEVAKYGLAVLVGRGFAHARRTGEDEELLPSHAPHGALVSA